jgi:ubiquinone/menaquinone biosynthesis C-methylase UbiE
MTSRQYFDQVAQQWDQMRQSFFSEAVREKAYAVAGVQADQTAADIGAGTGFISEGLLRRGLQVVAVDQSAAMLEEMKRKFAQFAGADYRLGEAESLPLPDGAVDYVFANMYLHHVASPLQAVKEMARLLKPGGKLVITDLDEHSFEFLRTEQHDRWPGFQREDVRRWFTEAELKNVAVDCVGESCCAQSSCGCQSASVIIFVASGEK